MSVLFENAARLHVLAGHRYKGQRLILVGTGVRFEFKLDAEGIYKALAAAHRRNPNGHYARILDFACTEDELSRFKRRRLNELYWEERRLEGRGSVTLRDYLSGFDVSVFDS